MQYKYPEPLKRESGCKVCWRTYANESDAQQASKVAEEERAVRLRQGYDFGYQWPGNIRKNANETYTVTCP